MSTADHSGTPLPNKLGVSGDVVFHVRRAPANFAEQLGDLDGAVWQRSLLAPLDVVVAFHTTRKAVREEWPKLTAAAEPSGTVWIAFPKKGAGMATDITDDGLRADLLKTGWVDNKVCSIDETWTGLRFAQRVEQRRPKDNAKRR